MSQFDNVTVLKAANIYHDGKAVSHTVLFADGSRKTLGVILPGSYNFGTEASEVMELNAGTCRVKLAGESEWRDYRGGERFDVPGNSRFDIEVSEILDYTCHYG